MDITHSECEIAKVIELPEDEVQLWRVDLEAIAADESRWRNVLSTDELTRASRFHFARDRESFTASRAILRTILAGYLATDPRGIRFSYSEKEKPLLAAAHAGSDVTFNLSHSGGIAMLAFTRRREIGIDVEQVRRDFDAEAIANRFFSAAEHAQLAELPAANRFEAFFRCWTRKEAYIKATGEGLSLPLHQFDVSIAAGENNALLATRPNSSEAALWSMRDIPAFSGYVAALCVRGHDWHLKG